MMTPSAPQVKTTMMTTQLNQANKTQAQPMPLLSSSLPRDSFILSGQTQTPQQAVELTVQRLTDAQRQANVSQKLFQTSNAINSLATNFNRQPGYQAYLPALHAMSEQANALLDIVDNPDLSTAKPHKLSPPETSVVKNMIFDLAHCDPRVAASARKSLRALGLSDHQLDALTSKIKEESKKKLS